MQDVEFKIESGVEIPSFYRTGRWAELGSAFESLLVGQSIFVPAKNGQAAAKDLQSVRTCFLRNHHREYTARVVKGGFRIWKIKKGE